MTRSQTRYYLVVSMCYVSQVREEWSWVSSTLYLIKVPVCALHSIETLGILRWNGQATKKDVLINNKWVFKSFFFFLLRLFTEHAFPRPGRMQRIFSQPMEAAEHWVLLSWASLAKHGRFSLSQGFPHAQCSRPSNYVHLSSCWAPQYHTAYLLIHPLLLIPWKVYVGIYLIDDKTCSPSIT